MSDSTHQVIAGLVRRVAGAQLALTTMLNTACPGPHRYVQHRDHQPPWCPACGYTGGGIRVKETQP